MSARGHDSFFVAKTEKYYATCAKKKATALVRFRGAAYNKDYVKGQKEETKGKNCTSPLPLKSYLPGG
jgi:hypothetical protein